MGFQLCNRSQVILFKCNIVNSQCYTSACYVGEWSPFCSSLSFRTLPCWVSFFSLLILLCWISACWGLPDQTNHGVFRTKTADLVGIFRTKPTTGSSGPKPYVPRHSGPVFSSKRDSLSVMDRRSMTSGDSWLVRSSATTSGASWTRLKS